MKAIAEFRRKLEAGHTCVGTLISYTDPLVVDALADSVDFFWIDLEHALMSHEALAGHLLAARSRNVPSIVRVTSGSTPFIKPVLDAGADGIMVPQIRTADEVKSVVADCRYSPLGQRGFGPRVTSNYGRDAVSKYIENANANMFVSIQIETKEALDSLDEILAVPGLDSVVIGPWDLSAALGMLGAVEHPTVVSAIKTITSKARAAGLFVGAGVGSDPNYARMLAGYGIQWMQVGSDYGYLVSEADRIASAVRSDRSTC